MFFDEYKITAKNKRRIEDLYKKLKENTGTVFGYPCNNKFDYSEIAKFLDLSVNNVGDPFEDSNYRISTRDFEREVLNFFAKLMHIEKKDFWGYVTNGGTEGNIYGLYLARETFPKGIIYFSIDSHYSISKAIKILSLKSVIIESQNNGEIDYNNLEKLLKKNKKYPAIISANIGTTMKGSVDNVETIVEILEKNKIRNYYIHCDAAFFGMILPFIRESPVFDFRAPISSITISGHKMMGSPIPCGIALARKRIAKKVARPIEYLGILDDTLSGSRNALTPLIFWYAIKKYGKKGFGEIVKTCLDSRSYLLKRLKGIEWPAWVNRNSIIVVIKKPPGKIVRKWQLAVQGDIAHVITVLHVTKNKIDEFIEDLNKA